MKNIKMMMVFYTSRTPALISKRLMVDMLGKTRSACKCIEFVCGLDRKLEFAIGFYFLSVGALYTRKQINH